MIRTPVKNQFHVRSCLKHAFNDSNYMSQIFANGQRQNINLLNNTLNFSGTIYTLPEIQKRSFSKTLTVIHFSISLLLWFSFSLKSHPINVRLLVPNNVISKHGSLTLQDNTRYKTENIEYSKPTYSLAVQISVMLIQLNNIVTFLVAHSLLQMKNSLKILPGVISFILALDVNESPKYKGKSQL